MSDNVSVGVATVVGYLTAVLAALGGVATSEADPWLVKAVLYAGAIITAIATTYGRQRQATEKIRTQAWVTPEAHPYEAGVNATQES